MRARARRQALAVIIVALIATIIAWYATYPRVKYAKLNNLIEIAYTPVAYPALVFKFEDPVGADAATISSMSASLQSFTPAADAPAGSAELVDALTASGGVPFVPSLLPDPTQLATNTLPSGVTPSNFAAPMVVRGTGSIWMTPASISAN